jgi:hypothetical protein
MPLDTQMPAWLGQRATWELQSASEAIGKFNPYMDYMAGKATHLKVQEMQLNLANGFLQQQQQEQQIGLTKMVMADKEQGIKEYPEWLRSTGGDPQKMVDTPFTGTSQSAAQQVQQTQLAAWQRTIQQQAVTAKMTDAENKVKIANIRAQSDSQRIAMYGKIAEMRANAAKANKSYEFEQLQNDWQDATTQLSKETDLDNAAVLRSRIQQDTDRMKKLSMFAAEVPKTTDETIKYDADGKPIEKTTKSSGGDGAGSTASTKGRVKVKDKDGRLFTLPSEQLQNAIDEGYTEVK